MWSRLVLQRLAAPPRPRYEPVWSEWIIAEIWRVLTWRWLLAHGPGDEAGLARAANRMMRRLLGVMRLASLHGAVGRAPWPGLADPEDAPIWATAVAARAGYVVSNNTADFPPLVEGRHVYEGVEYLTAIEFVENLLGADAAEVYAGPLPAGARLRSGRAKPDA